MQPLLNIGNIHKGVAVLFHAASIFRIGFYLGTGETETATEQGMRGFTLIL